MQTIVNELDILENDFYNLQIKMYPYFKTIEVSCPIDPKSILSFGNITINSTKHFNWFQKIMYKVLLGIKIVDFRHDIDH